MSPSPPPATANPLPTPVTVTVNDINEAPDAPMVVGSADDLNVDENDEGATVTSLEAPSDPDADDTVTLSVDDDRFEITDARILKLKDGVSLDHEDESSHHGAEVELVITATDAAGLTASTTLSVMVNDVNEPANVTGTVDNITVEAGDKIDVSIDLTALFTDQDDGDKAIRWELDGNPSWLGLEVEYVTQDGKEKVIGHLRGVPPTTGSDSAASHKVTLTAKDAGGLAAEVSFYVIVDDGNDPVTNVNLLVDGKKVVDVEVDENDSSGVVLGKITVDDIDHPMHPNGMHHVTVKNSKFEIRKDADGGLWLALKAGESLDYEGDNKEVTVTVTAVDMNGEKTATGANKGTSKSTSFSVVINDKNDAPVAQTVGNWWVTVDEDLESGNASAGEWLKFQLEIDDGDFNSATGDKFPAFTDQDINVGDKLTYSISGPSWLEIDKDDGIITNAKGAVPKRGVYGVTVTATDKAGASDSASFNLNVALSSDQDDFTDDNDEPSAKVTSEPGYKEGSGEQRVATFTVTDRDQDIPDHLFAIKSVVITKVENISDASGDTDANDDLSYTAPATQATDITGYGGAFRLSDPVKSGNTWTYHIYARDTDPRASVNTLDSLDHEKVEEIEITVLVTDGVTDNYNDAADQEILEIQVDIEDVNEKPSIDGATASNPYGIITRANRTVNQSENNALDGDTDNADDDPKILLYINLEDLWADDRDDDDDLTYGASTSGASWIRILHGPGEWRDLIKGPDGNTGGGDDLVWGDPAGNVDEGREIGADPADANDDLFVVVVEIDRTDRNMQGDKGSFTLTARDDDGATATLTVPVIVADENEAIGEDAVTLDGSAREDGTLRARFNENKDPDLAGAESPVLVLYTWQVSNDATIETTDTVISAGVSNDSLKLTQDHVGKYVGVTVTYYEVINGQINSVRAGGNDGQAGGTAKTARPVLNTLDDGVGDFTITVGSDTLRAAVIIRDEDVTGDSNASGTFFTLAAPKYSWQVSDNGRGGWTEVGQAGDTDTSTLELDDGKGKYYRAVATYDADGTNDANVDDDKEAMDSVYSNPIRVADVANAEDTTTTPTTPDKTPAALTPSGNAHVGGTLSVSGTGVSSVQWQWGSGGSPTSWNTLPVTGDLSVSKLLGGTNLRALVTYESTDPDNPGVTAVVASNSTGIVTGGSATARPAKVKNHTIEASVMGTGHASSATGNVGDGVLSGQTVSVAETVPLASLFQDPDTADGGLHFVVKDAPTSPAPAGTNGSSLYAEAAQRANPVSYVYQTDEGVLVLDRDSGKLTYVSDQLRGHDGNIGDGLGNALTVRVHANDDDSGDVADSGDSSTAANVTIRINVAPTGIVFQGTGVTAADDAPIVDTAYSSTTAIILNEEKGASGKEVLATINVQDENLAGTLTTPGHKFGAHTVTVSGDDRFVIANDRDGDNSTWHLKLKAGAKFDFEKDGRDLSPGVDADNADGDNDDATGATDDKQIKLTFMATDGGGLSTPTPTPTNGYRAITLIVTIKDDTTDDAPSRSGNTPGLKDDEDGDTDDTADGTNDNDVDGGDPTPPPPGTSVGGIIESFVDNMNGYEQDLFEDFMLVIDDGLDIA